MYTREEFEHMRKEEAKRMFLDKKLINQMSKILQKADSYHWIHQTTFAGEPSLQLPQDLFAIQEIIYKTKPTTIIEVGVCWAGTSLFISHLKRTGLVIAIDKYIPEDLKKRVENKNKGNCDLCFIEGDSVSNDVLELVKKYKFGDSTFIILDSNHTHEHVYQELKLYSQFLNVGDYIVVCDTIIEDFEDDKTSRERPWGKGNNPRTALQQFLKENTNFEIDTDIQNKLLLSCQPDGYIRRIK